MMAQDKIHQCTLMTYLAQEEEELAAMNQLVYTTLKKIQPATRAEVARACGLSVQNMCWRFKELREKGKIVSGVIRNCKANQGSFAKEWWCV